MRARAPEGAPHPTQISHGSARRDSERGARDGDGDGGAGAALPSARGHATRAPRAPLPCLRTGADIRKKQTLPPRGASDAARARRAVPRGLLQKRERVGRGHRGRARARGLVRACCLGLTCERRARAPLSPQRARRRHGGAMGRAPTWLARGRRVGRRRKIARRGTGRVERVPRGVWRFGGAASICDGRLARPIR